MFFSFTCVIMFLFVCVMSDPSGRDLRMFCIMLYHIIHFSFPNWRKILSILQASAALLKSFMVLNFIHIIMWSLICMLGILHIYIHPYFNGFVPLFNIRPVTSVFTK